MTNIEYPFFLIGLFLLFIIILPFCAAKHRELICSYANFYAQLDALAHNYISQSQLASLQSEYQKLYKTSYLVPLKKSRQFIKDYKALPTTIKSKNTSFVSDEIAACSSLFDNVEEKSLDRQQREAIVTDEDCNLIVAGAGTGKTLTIAGKIKYLCERKHIAPNDILLFAYERKNTEELETRISFQMGYSVEVKTFHSFGLSLIAKSNNAKPDIVNENDISAFYDEYLHNSVCNRPEVLKNLILFLGFYYGLAADDNTRLVEIESFGVYAQDRNVEKWKRFISDFAIYGIQYDKNPLKTYQGEIVKSKQELLIANYLFTHGIKYQYETRYPFPTEDVDHRPYHPDFYLVDYDIYYEHFGIDRSGRASHLPENEEIAYLKGINWKRNTHKEHNTKLIETYSWQQEVLEWFA